MTPEKIAKRKEIDVYFRQVAQTENAKNQNQVPFESLLDPNDKKRVIIVLKESIGDIFLITSLFESIRSRYPKPEWTFYFATDPSNFEILDGNPFVDKIVPYIPQMESLIWLEGQGAHKGFFDIAYLPFITTQRQLGYLHNGCDLVDFQFKNPYSIPMDFNYASN